MNTSTLSSNDRAAASTFIESTPADYARGLGIAARRAATALSATDADTRTAVIRRLAAKIREDRAAILDANAKDIDAARSAGLTPAMIERLRLDDKRIAKMADGIDKIAEQPDPVWHTMSSYVRPDGLRVERKRAPIGVVLFFYESRPNVTTDAAALCLRSGNAVILRGGKEAIHSNQALAASVWAALIQSNLDPACVQLVHSTDRTLVPLLLKLDRHIDLVIPRGGCLNAKTGYPGGGVCNAAEKILIHRSTAHRLLPGICEDLKNATVEIRGDAASRDIVPEIIPATESDWPEEYLSLVVAVKVVDTIESAIDHINEFGSHHTDAILSTDADAIELFSRKVDSASIMINASTRFADGGEYGLGAEIGISTDKLHARGPMGADDLTTYKWIVTGDGHVRR